MNPRIPEAFDQTDWAISFYPNKAVAPTAAQLHTAFYFSQHATL
jgi:hypothetical protein